MSEFNHYYEQVTRGFLRKETGDVVHFTVKNIEQAGVCTHAFTTRLNGLGYLPDETITALPKENPDMMRRKRNLAGPMAAIGLEADKLVLVNADHSSKVQRVGRADCGKGYEIPYREYMPVFDGVITNEKEVCLNTTHADCTGVFFVDPVKKAIGLCHAGWRGTVAGVIRNTVRALTEEYGCNPGDIIAGVTPNIGFCCFEVSKDVIKRVDSAYPTDETAFYVPENTPGKFRADLNKMAAYDLFYSGVPAKNVTIAGLCTCCDSETFYSYRREHRLRGVMSALIQLQ